MKNRGSKGLMKIIASPKNMLVKAGNLYLKTMNEYEKADGGHGMTLWSGGVMWGLPTTNSKPLAKSSRGNSVNSSMSKVKNKGIKQQSTDMPRKTMVNGQELGSGRGKKGGKVAPMGGATAVVLDGVVRSSSIIVVRMEKIEEDEPCDFGDED
ncbi:hypothetical protein Drorol1_Dr00010103 [Drosera rotundifolia]